MVREERKRRRPHKIEIITFSDLPEEIIEDIIEMQV
jgi:hypothetical protein